MTTLPTSNIQNWIHEYQLLAQQRMQGHELNNHMTPLHMHISMLGQQLAAGDLEKAKMRYEKVKRSLEKLQEYAQNQFHTFDLEEEHQTVLDRETLASMIESIRNTYSFESTIHVSDGYLASKNPINTKILCLMIYHILKTVESQNIKVPIQLNSHVTDDNKHLIVFQFPPLASIADSFDFADIKRFAKLLNSTSEQVEIRFPTDNPLRIYCTFR